jgi:glutaredoxin
MFIARPSLAGRIAALALATVACAAGAQQVYRIVGPDGKVTFSDKPPTEPGVKASAAPTLPLPGGAAGGSLPFELRQVSNRYPVTLYTGADCGPCNSGRLFLSSRGIPFTEKTVSTNEDISALQRLTGAATLPLVTIGGQQLAGYSEAEWTQFLDAAGYPKTSQLPPSYRQPAATPLVVASTPARAPAAPAAAAAPIPTSGPATPPGNNPAGIQF